jgi:glycosyltransferase involved in cell wall biosynthesis
MRVLVLTPNIYGFSPGQRTSIELWERRLNQADITLTFRSFETDKLHSVIYKRGKWMRKSIEIVRAYFARLGHLADLSDFDAVFVYREAALIGPAWIEKFIARKGIPIIYQLDDPLYIPYRSPFSGYLSYLKCFSKVAEICKIARVVIVNSSHHRQFAEQYNSNIWYVPSIVDTDAYSYNPADQEPEPVTIGWSGSPSTKDNVSVVADALRVLSNRVPHKVHLIGSTDFSLPGVRYTAQPWNAATEIADLRKIQVGMAPLPETEWNKRKFYLKVAQYMALGIPPVCTPLGSNPSVIEHGINGFLASTTDEWVHCLETLIRDKELRLRMSRRAAEDARAKYSLEANAPNVIHAFQSALTPQSMVPSDRTQPHQIT